MVSSDVVVSIALSGKQIGLVHSGGGDEAVHEERVIIRNLWHDHTPDVLHIGAQGDCLGCHGCPVVHQLKASGPRRGRGRTVSMGPMWVRVRYWCSIYRGLFRSPEAE